MKRKWVHAVVLAVACVVLLCLGVAADTVAEGTCGENLTWVLDDAGVLTISGEGEMEDYGTESSNRSPWFTYANSMYSIVFEEGITSIGDFAFWCCSSPISSIALPNSLTSIGNHAFENCTSIYKIEFPSNLVSIGDYAFSGCSEITAIEFPSSLTFMGYCAFSTCERLSKIALNSDVSSSYSFYNTNLQYVYISNKVTEIDNSICRISSIVAFDVFDTDGEGLQSIDDVLYYYDSYLESYTLIRYPSAKEGSIYTVIDETETIGMDAFYDCDYLTEVYLPDTVKTLEGAFDDCDNLTTLRWSPNITSYGSFDDTPLAKIVLSEHTISIPRFSTVTNYDVQTETGIGYRDIDGVLFYYNDFLKQLTLIAYPDGRTDSLYIIPNGTHKIGGGAFGEVYSLTTPAKESLTNITFPNTVKEIDMYAFYGCISLSKIEFNDGLISIEDQAFCNCTGLKEVSFPSTLETIGEDSFLGCTQLEEISFPISLSSIGEGAFGKCSALRKAYFIGDAPKCGNRAFKNTHSTFTIYYVEGKSGWTSPTWNGYNTATFVPKECTITIDYPEPTKDKVVTVPYGQENYLGIEWNHFYYPKKLFTKMVTH